MRTRTCIIALIWALSSLLILAVYGQDVDVIDSTDSIAITEDVRLALVYTLVVEGAIGTVTNDRIDMAIDEADDNKADLLVIYMDTPGGFTNSTWSICKNILNADLPICVYIAPRGARAGSAGVYITYASHIAAMAPSTNIGAAHPVSGGGEEIDSVMNEKITNDAVAQIKAAAEERGRNAVWAEKAVRESVSITDKEALELNVIDLRADDLDDLLSQLDGRTIELPDRSVTLHTKKHTVVDLEMTFVHKLLKIITQPDIAFILFSLGGLGLVLELYNPGAIFPGVVGAICLILAFYAFQTLPINYAGVALIVLAMALFIAEIKVVSHGLLTIGGAVALFLGGLMLVDTVDPSLRVSLSVLVTVVVCIGVAAGLTAWMVIRTARKQPFIGNEGMIGKTAEVRGGGFVYVDGALWKATCDVELTAGDMTKVVAVDKLTLKVKKKDS